MVSANEFKDFPDGLNFCHHNGTKTSLGLDPMFRINRSYKPEKTESLHINHEEYSQKYCKAREYAGFY